MSLKNHRDTRYIGTRAEPQAKAGFLISLHEYISRYVEISPF